MRSTTDSARPLYVLAVIAGLSLTMAACNVEGVPHSYGTRVDYQRPECPQRWDSLPIFPDGREARGVMAVPSAAPATAPATTLALSGPITDIPEFHDCQKFLLDKGTTYDSLYAVFAAYKLDSIVNGLGWDSVLWTSSNPAIATVSAAGVVTAVAAGVTTITGVAVTAAERTVTVLTTIAPLAASDSVGSIGHMMVMSGASTPVALGVGQSISLSPALAKMTTSTMPVAVIYTYGPGYKPLGIGANFSCLYIYFDASNRLQAKIIPVNDLGPSIHACHDAYNPNQPGPAALEIRMHHVSNAADIPPVARWDYDTVSQQQYVGIKCFSAWCEIGPKGFTSSSGLVARPGVGGGERRVIENKGWYDQQYLAITDATGKAVPSRLKGTVIPDPNLGLRGPGQAPGKYAEGWQPVAYVGFDTAGAGDAAVAQYRSKFGFEPSGVTELKEMNRLELCYGTRRHCGVKTPPSSVLCAKGKWWTRKWWVKLVPPGDGTPKYRCITRRLHDVALAVPHTARWRWLVDDETVWEECTQGCCEVVIGPDAPGWE